MPNPCNSGTPRSFQASMIASAHGAPPTPATRRRVRSVESKSGCCIMNWYGAGTPKKWVMPWAGSPSTASVSPGSNCLSSTTVPPAWSTGLL